MSVVISEFEVVGEAAQEAPAEAGSAAALPVSAPTPNDLEQFMRRQEERAARVRAD